jgi:hypothetical protein
VQLTEQILTVAVNQGLECGIQHAKHLTTKKLRVKVKNVAVEHHFFAVAFNLGNGMEEGTG